MLKSYLTIKISFIRKLWWEKTYQKKASSLNLSAWFYVWNKCNLSVCFYVWNKYKLCTCTNVRVKPVQNWKNVSFCFQFPIKIHMIQLHIYISWYGCSEHTHQPVLILEAAKKICRLPRNICDNITTVTKNVCRLGMTHSKF